MSVEGWIALIGTIGTIIGTFVSVVALRREKKETKAKQELQKRNEELLALNKKLDVANQKLLAEEERRCAKNCKDITNYVGNLIGNLDNACDVVSTYCLRKGGECSILVSSIHAANEITSDLIRFCEDLNDEHNSQFGHPVYLNIKSELEKTSCVLRRKN